MRFISYLGGLVKSEYKVDVTKCFLTDVHGSTIRQSMVDWLEAHVGSTVTRCAYGTPTAGDGWRFVNKTEIASIECASVGLGPVVFGQTYKEKIYLVFDDEAQAIHFKLSWNDRL
jgi:hypothetical protein